MEKEQKDFLARISKDRVAEHLGDTHLFCYRNVMTTVYADGHYNYEGTLDAWVTDLKPEDKEKAENFLNPVPEGITMKLEVC